MSDSKYSPSDLTLFMHSPFASWMKRFSLEFPDKAPEKDPDDALMGVLQNKGFQHEKAQEELFKSQGLSVQKIEAEIIEQKKQAFKNFIEWIYARWHSDSAMYIYHYANYEIAACRKLMGRYGICEHELG